jgi:hypothetical protein
MPYEESLYGPKSKLPCFGTFASTGNRVEDPGNLGSRKVGIDQQAGFRLHLLFVSRRFQRVASAGGAPVLPDDCGSDWFAGLPVPDERRLALIGDADTGDPFHTARLGKGLAANAKGFLPDRLSILLDPAIGGISQRHFLLRQGNLDKVPVEHDGPR